MLKPQKTAYTHRKVRQKWNKFLRVALINKDLAFLNGCLLIKVSGVRISDGSPKAAFRGCFFLCAFIAEVLFTAAILCKFRQITVYIY